MAAKINGHLATCLVIGGDHHDECCASAIAQREEEIHSYLLNIENYEAMQSDPECPADLKATLAERIANENRELDKSRAVYRALLSQLPKGAKRDKAIQAVKTKRAAQKA